MDTVDHPEPFLTIRYEDLSGPAPATAWCAGYENGEWRDRQLAEHLIEWLPEFALRYSEWNGIRHHNAVRMFAKAAQSIYLSTKYKSRGEFGEVLLHAMIRQRFKTIPAISKYYYKDSNNDTVKGFDAVHVVENEGELELWLGEAKFYEKLTDAIAAITAELEEHTQRDYLRNEFAAITNKIDDSSPFAEKLKKLIDKNTSLDEIFARTCIPLLITYDSDAVGKNKAVCATYDAEFKAEVEKNYRALLGKIPGLPAELRLQVLLFPLKSKQNLIKVMDEVLKTWQERA